MDRVKRERDRFVGTHLGCSPTYLPDSFSEQVQGVRSGFFCLCAVTVNG